LIKKIKLYRFWLNNGVVQINQQHAIELYNIFGDALWLNLSDKEGESKDVIYYVQ
jgi:hypothetical protein